MEAGLRRRADRRSPALVVQVEANSRVQPIAKRLERLAFRRLQPQRVTIDVDALRVASLEALRPVRVEHRHDVQRQTRQDPRRPPGPDDGGEGTRRRSKSAEVAVDSSPCICDHSRTANGSVARLDVVDRPPFDRFADLLDRERSGALDGKIGEPPNDFGVVDERRERRRYVLRVPDRAELARVRRADSFWAVRDDSR